MKFKVTNQNVFFTSDTHFGHTNVIKYDNRPFKSIVEHDEALISNWNAIVPADATVFHLGDVGWKGLVVQRILERLNGTVHLLKGNHDKFNGVRYYDYVELMIPDDDTPRKNQEIVLCHYPIAEWNKCHYGAWMLHGHCHGNCAFTNSVKYKILDVGTCNHNYRPISYNDVKRYMNTRETLQHH